MATESSNFEYDMRSNKGKKKLSRQNRNNIVPMVNKSNDSNSWPHFQDEDYIVFCFREDGAFDVVKDCNSEALGHFDAANKSPRSVNRKLKYGGEVAETVRNRSNRNIEEGEEEQSNTLDIKSSSVASTRSYQAREIQNRGTSVVSSDSNHSDSSTGSFSFPVLHWEPIGSPVQMPKSEGLCIRKYKVPCARFQCCRF